MALTFVPDADTDAGNYLTYLGANSSLYTMIDESAVNNTDYITSPDAPSSEVAVFSLSNGGIPFTSAGSYLSVTYRQAVSNAATTNITFQLREDYVNESSQGTLINSTSYNSISNSWTTSNITLTNAEAASITNWNGLFVRIVSTGALD